MKHQGDWQLQEVRERECECPPSNHSSLLRCHYPHELSHSADWLVIVGCSVCVTHEHPRIIIDRQSRSWFKHLRAKLSNSAWIQITFIQTHKCLPSFIYLLYFAKLLFFFFFGGTLADKSYLLVLLFWHKQHKPKHTVHILKTLEEKKLLNFAKQAFSSINCILHYSSKKIIKSDTRVFISSKHCFLIIWSYD